MLRKNAGTKGAKIGIVFHCQDTEEDSKFEDDDMFDQEPQDEEDVEESAQAVRFGVVVSKGGKTVVLQCRCGYELNVDGVIVRDGDMESVLAQLAGGEGLHAALYQVRFIILGAPFKKIDSRSILNSDHSFCFSILVCDSCFVLA